MRWPPASREIGLALAACLIVLTAVSQLSDLPAIRGLETASLDLRFRLRGPRPVGPEIAVVLFDDRSLAALGRWPVSRRLFAQALHRLDEAGAKLVVFDLLFAEADQPVAPELRDVARAAKAAGGDPQLVAMLQRLVGEDPDGEFAAAMSQGGKVLLPIAFGFDRTSGEAPESLSDSAYAQFDKSARPVAFALQPLSATLPIPRLAQAAAGLANVNVVYDRDGEVRYDYAAVPFDGDFYPSMSIRAAAEFEGVPWNEVALALGEGVRIGQRLVPTDAAMRLLINYPGPRGTVPTYSFADLMAGQVPASALEGRLVLIGASFTGNADSFASPYGSVPVPGTERIADSIDTILQGRFIIDNPPDFKAPAVVATLLLAALTGWVAAFAALRVTMIVGALGMVAALGAAQLAFLHGLWLPVVGPVAALLAASATVTLYRYWAVEREGQRIRSAFRHYMAPDMVEILAAHPERLRLGGETRPMTLLFCDIRGFTSISEQFKANPQGLTRLINRFLTPMTDLIMARRGTIDKYMGDCIMAFWNAPLDNAQHADHACASALAMIAGLGELNDQLRAEAEAANRTFHRLDIGIGLNTGTCVVGNMGSERRFDYSVLGDAVNLASRLEGQSKTYGVSIVIGEATRADAPHWAALELDLIAVQGKKEAVRIYGLLGDENAARAPDFMALDELHGIMLRHYRAQDWTAAREALARCRGRDRRLEKLYDLYEHRIDAYAVDPPGADWDGVYVARSK